MLLAWSDDNARSEGAVPLCQITYSPAPFWKRGHRGFFSFSLASGQPGLVEHFQKMVVAYHKQVEIPKRAHTQGVSHSEVTQESPVEIVPRADSPVPSDAPCSKLWPLSFRLLYCLAPLQEVPEYSDYRPEPCKSPIFMDLYVPTLHVGIT